MMSVEVDRIWHQFILFTREYATFCEINFGCFLHHSPVVPGAPEEIADKSFFDIYRAAYGQEYVDPESARL